MGETQQVVTGSVPQAQTQSHSRQPANTPNDGVSTERWQKVVGIANLSFYRGSMLGETILTEQAAPLGKQQDSAVDQRVTS